METIKMYKASNGTIHNSKQAAEVEESLIDCCKFIVDTYLPKITGRFSSGNGYYQCNILYVNIAREKFLELANTLFKPKEPFTSVYGIVGRYISDSGTQAFNELYHRLVCIDDRYRMWDQQYFKNNPHEAEDVCLNP